MIAPLFCLLLPFAAPCPQYVDLVPSIRLLEREKARYDGKVVNLKGSVARLWQWRSKDRQYAYEMFFLCDGRACVHVFMEANSPIRQGQTVLVRGPYYRMYRTAKVSYPNEVEATEIRPSS